MTAHKRLLAVVAGLGLITILSISMVLSAPAQATSIPTGTSGQTYYAAYPRTNGVNGSFSEWSGVPRVRVTTGPQPAANVAADGTMTFAATADTNYLYLWIDVAKSKIIAGQHGTDYTNEDSVEIFINGTGNLGLTSYTSGVARIVIPAASIGRSAGDVLLSGQNYQNVGVRASVVKTATGYAVEASIPLRNSRWNITPVNNKAIGFNIQVNGATIKDRNIRLNWSSADTGNQSYTNPSVFGRLIFFDYRISPTSAPQATATRTVQPTVTKTVQPTATRLAPTQTATAVPPTPALVANGFNVRGSKIYGPDGKEFVVKGVNVNGYNWVWRRSTVNDARLIDDCWGFNLVRVNSFLFSGEQAWPQYGDNNNLDQIVQTFTSRGVVVMFEAHDRIGRYYTGSDLTKLLDWFYTLAQRYRNNPYVWFDIINEPGGRNSIDKASWVGIHQQAIQKIRDAAGANNIIIVEGANGGQDAGSSGSGLVPTSASAILSYGKEVITFNGKTYGNIVFSIHPYDQWNYGSAKMTDFFDRVHANNHAIIVGEWGILTDVDTKIAAQSTFQAATSRGVGRIAWHWDGQDWNDLTANTTWGGGWEINHCANPTNLSWMGQQAWKDTHGG